MRPRQSSLGIKPARLKTRGFTWSFNEAEAIKPRNLEHSLKLYKDKMGRLQ